MPTPITERTRGEVAAIIDPFIPQDSLSSDERFLKLTAATNSALGFLHLLEDGDPNQICILLSSRPEKDALALEYADQPTALQLANQLLDLIYPNLEQPNNHIHIDCQEIVSNPQVITTLSLATDTKQPRVTSPFTHAKLASLAATIFDDSSKASTRSQRRKDTISLLDQTASFIARISPTPETTTLSEIIGTTVFTNLCCLNPKQNPETSLFASTINRLAEINPDMTLAQVATIVLSAKQDRTNIQEVLSL